MMQRLPSRFVRSLMPGASSEEIARAEETMERFFEAIYQICERIGGERHERRDKSPARGTLEDNNSVEA